MSDDEERIRELAYQIWQSEGCPEGQHDRHWEMARRLVETGQHGQGGAAEETPPPAKPASTRKPRSVKPVETAPAAGKAKAKPKSEGKSETKKPRTTRTPPPGA